MLNKPLDKVVFLDIETVPEKESFFDLSIRKQQLFAEKFKKDVAELGLGDNSRLGVEVGKSVDLSAEADNRAKMELLYANKAPLFPEFGKIICISIGFIKPNQVPSMIEDLPVTKALDFQTVSFYGHDEKELLKKFHESTAKMIDARINIQYSMCSHNGFNFDWPYIGKKFVMHSLPIPAFFDYGEKKPWDVTWFIDTKNIWKWGVYDGNVSLDLLCEVFDVPTSKDDIKGSQVRDVYYKDKNLERIKVYCEKDCIVLAQIYLKMKGLPNKLING